MIGDGETVRFRIGEQDRTTIVRDRRAVADETLGLVLCVLDDADDTHARIRIAQTAEDTFRHAVLQETPVYDDDVGHRPFGMLRPPPQDFFKRGQIVPRMFATKQELAIRIPIGDISPEYGHHADGRCPTEVRDIIRLDTDATTTTTPVRFPRVSHQQGNVVDMSEAVYSFLCFLLLNKTILNIFIIIQF